MKGTRNWFAYWHTLAAVSGCVLILFAAAPKLAAGGKISASKYQQQLGDRFTSWDLNGDGFLDKEELAKAFRGKDARPYDEGNNRSQVMGVALISLPRPSMAVQLALADRLGDAKSVSDYSKLADFQFLIAADTNNDQQVSLSEFKAWVKGYARSLAQRDQAQSALQKARARLSAAKTPKAQQTAQMAVNTASARLTQAQGQVNAVPIAIRQALNVGNR
jgi:hypothetical protein